MPNGYNHDKEYGGHDYDDHGTSDCRLGCGCWAGPTRSGSKVPGVDPFGECPMNPKDGKLQISKGDFEIVIERRIRYLQNEAYRFSKALDAVRPDEEKEKILRENNILRAKLREALDKLRQIGVLCQGIVGLKEILERIKENEKE
jgi:hypothetical protein